MQNKKAFLYIIGFLAVVFVGFLVSYSTHSIVIGIVVTFVPGVFVFEYIKDIIEELKK